MTLVSKLHSYRIYNSKENLMFHTVIVIIKQTSHGSNFNCKYTKSCQPFGMSIIHTYKKPSSNYEVDVFISQKTDSVEKIHFLMTNDESDMNKEHKLYRTFFRIN
uniref:Uncharacterized protein n=1 Tax=Schistosoma mansoni TaxID=6183 RepID=A0A5K4F884_SCHMA